MAAQGDDCYFYYYSTCTKGDSCQFRHCPEALGNEMVCTLWRAGRCQRTICNYRHMEIEKNRSRIQCFWESQPSGCLKEHCSFRHMRPRGVDTSWTSSPTKLATDVRNTLTSSGSVPVKKVIPAPVVEPVVVTPEEESDETSSTEVSPVKKIPFPSSSLLGAVKEDASKPSDAGQLNFGIKTLSQIRQKNSRQINVSQNTTFVASGQPGDSRKIVSLKGTSSSQIEGGKLSSSVHGAVVPQKVGESGVGNINKRITLKTGDETSLITRRKFITSEKKEKPTRISLSSGGDSSEMIKENPSPGIKSLGQIMPERLQKSIQLNKSGVTERGDGGIKTLEQIRRERKVRVEMKMTGQGDALIGGVEKMEPEKMKPEKMKPEKMKPEKISKDESDIKEDGDLRIKSLDEIRKERLEKFASGDEDTGDSQVKSLEQIRRERIANRLGLKTEKENSVVISPGDLDLKRIAEKETPRTSVVNRLGRDVSRSKNTIHTRLGPSVKNDSLSVSGRKIQIKEGDVRDGGEIQSSQGDNQVVSRKIVKIRPVVSNSQGEESVVKPKRRRVTLIGGADEKDGLARKADATKADEKDDAEVNLDLSKSRVIVGRLAMDGAEEKNRRISEDSDESGNIDVKEEPKRKRILIKRNEDRLKSATKRRADRQIYQPPSAKSKERVSSVKTRIGQKAILETEKGDEEDKDEKDDIQKEVPAKKRPRITFQSDATSDQIESENVSSKRARSRLSNTDTLEKRSIKSGIVRIKPVLESSVAESEHSEPQPPKKKKGGGLRERLLKQTEKFTVGVAGGKLDSTSEKAEASDDDKNVWRSITDAEDVVVRDSNRGLSSGKANVELAEASIDRRRTPEIDDVRTDFGLAGGEQTVVSSSESSEMSGSKLGDTEKRIPDVGVVDSIPDSFVLSSTSEQKPLSSSNNILPDSTNQIIPSVAIAQAKTITSRQPIESDISESGAMDGKAQKESNVRSTKPRMSITDDDLDGLLDDVDGGDELDQFDDDDDALLNELEDLINA